MAQEKSKLISYQEAIKLKEDKGAVFFKTIPSNNGQVFALIDSSYLVIPLNPYASALLVYAKHNLDEMIESNVFPVNDSLNAFYHASRERIDNLDVYGAELINELNKYLEINNFSFENEKVIPDRVYDFFKSKRTLEKYKLNFIVFVAKYIITNYDRDLRIGLVKNKQTLDPLISIILLKQDSSGAYYFNLQGNIFGRSGYCGIEGLINSLSEFKRKPDPTFYEICKVFNWP